MNAYALTDTPLTDLLTCTFTSADGYWHCTNVAHPERPNEHWMMHSEAS